MTNTETTTLIQLKQEPIVYYAGLEGVSDFIDKRIKAMNIEGQVATPETVQSLKAMRTRLNKEFKEYEEQRKYIKNALLTPYNELEAKYKVLIAEKYQKADSQLKDKIYSVEDELKQTKTDEMTTYFAELCLSKNIDFVEFKDVELNVTLSASKKSLLDKIDAFVDKISAELNTINVLPEDDEFKAEVIAEYKATKDLNHSIKVIQDRREAKQAELRRQQEAKAMAEAKQAEEMLKPNPNAKIPEPLQAPKVEKQQTAPIQQPKLYETQFKVKGTLDQLKALKAFIIENGIELL